MLGKILNISQNQAQIQILDKSLLATNLLNLHVIFHDNNKKILGEIEDIKEDIISIALLGEYNDKGFIGGVIRKPSLDANVRIINDDELNLIVGFKTKESMILGRSPLYDLKPIYVDINDFFNSHMAVFGNTGAGKSCGVTRILQNIFNSQEFLAYGSNIFLFDVAGEYNGAFSNLNQINPNLNLKIYSSNFSDNSDKIKIPISLLETEDLALILGATEPLQLPILSKTLELSYLFSNKEIDSDIYKNHYLAKAIISVMYSNQTKARIRSNIFSILESCSTDRINLNADIPGIGYVRKFRKCYDIDMQGNFVEDLLISDFLQSFINDSLEDYEPQNTGLITLKELLIALNFTLITEGFLNNEEYSGHAITLRVRLQSLVSNENGKIFDYNKKTNLQQFITELITTNQGKKVQIINFNIGNLDDWFAKAITKIYARLLFDFTKKLTPRATIPFHLFLEEAHRYVQNDNDQYLFGYNIFERIAKEGRKYGILMTMISQRLTELSETAISQCNNFIIFKMNHPRDLEYVRKMIPNISVEIIEKMKTLQPGTAVTFGKAFKIPWIVKFDMPNPWPESNNCDIYKTWMVNKGG